MVSQDFATQVKYIPAGSSSTFLVRETHTIKGSPTNDSDGVLIRSIRAPSDHRIRRRIADLDGDSTLDADITIDDPTGSRSKETFELLSTLDAEIVIDNQGVTNDRVTVVGDFIPVESLIGVVQNIANGSEITTTDSSNVVAGTGFRVHEIVAGGACDVIVRGNDDDDSTWEQDFVDTSLTANSRHTTKYRGFFTSGRTNPEHEIAVQNTSGGAASFAILGTVTEDWA